MFTYLALPRYLYLVWVRWLVILRGTLNRGAPTVIYNSFVDLTSPGYERDCHYVNARVKLAPETRHGKGITYLARHKVFRVHARGGFGTWANANEGHEFGKSHCSGRPMTQTLPLPDVQGAVRGASPVVARVRNGQAVARYNRL